MKKENIVLIIGLILSIILITFKINNGIEILNLKINLSIIDIAYGKSSENFLTSTIIGYLCFLIFSILAWKKMNKDLRIYLLLFSLLTILAIYFEGTGISNEINGNFNGQHFRIGIPLNIFGLIIFNTQKTNN